MVSNSRPSRRLPASVLAATVLVLCALVALASRSGLHGTVLNGRLPVQTTATSRTIPAGHLQGGGGALSLPHWLGWTAIGLIAALALALLLRVLLPLRIKSRARGRADAEAEEALADFDHAPVIEEEETAARQRALRDAVLRSLDEIRRDPDARRAIIGAYRLMEAALASTGLARDPAEAPREYLARALDSLDVGQQAPRRLTALFERARFGDAELDLSLRDQAVEAFVELRDAL